MAHHGKVVADQHEGQAKLPDQVLQQVDHLRLDGDIQRADRFIADHQPGAADQGARDGDALALPAGKFVRPALRVLGAQAHPLQPLRHLGRFLPPRQAPVQAQRFGDGGTHRHARIQAGERVLEDHLHVRPARA